MFLIYFIGIVLTIGIIIYDNIILKKKNIQNSNQNVEESKVINPTIEKNKKDVNITLFLGVGLIILSSIIFATTTWNKFGDIEKILVLLFETFLSFGIGVLLKKKFKVPKVGDAFTLIGDILIGVVFLSVGYFKLLGDSFCLDGNLKYLFYSVLFYLQCSIFTLRRIILQKKEYFLILSFAYASIFFLTLQVTGNLIFSFVLISFILLVINIFKKKIFKDNLLSLNVLNIVLMIFLTFRFIAFSFVNLFAKPQFIDLIILGIFSFLLFINFIISVKDNFDLKFSSVVYNLFLTLIFSVTTKSLLFSSCFILFQSLIFFILYYFTKNHYLRIFSKVFSYLLGFISIILLSFSDDFIFGSSIISLVFIIFTILSLMKKNNILDYILQIVFVVSFVITTILNFEKTSILTLNNIVLMINIITFVYFIINTILRKNASKIYTVLLIIGFFFGLIASLDSNVLYLIMILFMNLIVYLSSIIQKNEFNYKISFYLAIELVTCLLFGFRYFELGKILVSTILLISFYFIHNTDERKAVFLSLLFVPFVMLLDISAFGINNDIRKYLAIFALIPCLINLTRNLFHSKYESSMCIIELIVFSYSILFLQNMVAILVYLIILLVIAYVFREKNKNSSIYYFTYLAVATPILALNVDYKSNLNVLLIIMYMGLHIFNQLLFIILYKNRNLIVELFHLILAMLVVLKVIDLFNLDNLSFAVFIAGIITLLSSVYVNKKIKNLSWCFMIYPLILILNTFTNGNINNLLVTFSFIFPISLFLRKVVEMDNRNVKTIEIIVLSIMYVLNIFIFSVDVAILLGIISGILILIGFIYKASEFKYFGYVSLILLVVIQTISLWQKFFWLIFLLVFGIALVIIAIYKESKKK